MRRTRRAGTIAADPNRVKVTNLTYLEAAAVIARFP
jgi:hypothetical protein